MKNISGNVGRAVQLRSNFSPAKAAYHFTWPTLKFKFRWCFKQCQFLKGNWQYLEMTFELGNCIHSKFSKVFIKTTHCFKSPATSKHKSPTDPATLRQAPKSPQPRFSQSQLLSQISMSISRWQLQCHDRCNTAWRSSLQHFSWHPWIDEGGLGPGFLLNWYVFRGRYFSPFYNYYNF